MNIVSLISIEVYTTYSLRLKSNQPSSHFSTHVSGGPGHKQELHPGTQPLINVYLYPFPKAHNKKKMNLFVPDLVPLLTTTERFTILLYYGRSNLTEQTNGFPKASLLFLANARTRLYDVIVFTYTGVFIFIFFFGLVYKQSS